MKVTKELQPLHELRAKPGDVFSFPVDDSGGWGLCQAVDAFAYDEADRVLDASFHGQPMVTLAFCDWVSAEKPKLSDFEKTKLLVLSYARWKDEEKLINVHARVPADFVLLGAAPPIARLTERCKKWGPWRSTSRYLRLQHEWDALPKEHTQAFRQAMNSTAKVAIPGVTDMKGRPVEVAVNSADFAENLFFKTTPEFQLPALHALPALSGLELHRWHEDLPDFLARRPTITSLSLVSGAPPRVDLSGTHLKKLVIHVAGVRELRLPASLRELVVNDGIDGAGLHIDSHDRGSRLSLRAGKNYGQINGLSSLRELTIANVKGSCDLSAIATTFPSLRIFKVAGSPTFLDNIAMLGELKGLENLSLIEAFGFSAADLPGPDRLPALTSIWASSIPEDVAKALRQLYQHVDGIDLDIDRARKPEWIKENLENPFRAWDGRDGVSPAHAKKALSIYKTAVKSMKKACADGHELDSAAEQITRTYLEGFNTLDAKARFVGTIEREEIVGAISSIWDSLPPQVDRAQLEQLVEAGIDF
jgi:hypothetical protein